MFIFLKLCLDHIVSSALSVKELHCMWLVPRTRASSNDVDGFRLWKSALRRTSYHALRWDDCPVESQEGLEIKVGLRADLVGAPGSVAWFYVNGECGGYGIEHSDDIWSHTHVDSLSVRAHCREAR
ncbi:hypothetical protein M9H77_21178 [Catharanthus roseus]|uniref:Uncharacterized protein n=1 Tax=Catharanthus roseus TaxID=4058 RepID=A0ACC0ALU7_CATRO|nr:hypothetical protein M9H77_21178 [Catharanthus roseus]